MNATVYRKYVQYGKHFSQHYWVDYVHTAWLRYFEKTGKDLFDERRSNRWIYQVVKHEFINSLRTQTQKWSNIIAHETTDLTVFGEEYIADNSPSIVESLIHQDIDRFIKEKIKRYLFGLNKSRDFELRLSKVLHTYELMKLGYTIPQIAYEVEISTATVVLYKRYIRQSLSHMSLVNPFNGDKTIIKKSISERTWKEKTKEEKKEYSLHDFNEHYNLYVNNETGDGLLVKLKEEKKDESE